MTKDINHYPVGIVLLMPFLCIVIYLVVGSIIQPLNNNIGVSILILLYQNQDIFLIQYVKQ